MTSGSTSAGLGPARSALDRDSLRGEHGRERPEFEVLDLRLHEQVVATPQHGELDERLIAGNRAFDEKFEPLVGVGLGQGLAGEVDGLLALWNSVAVQDGQVFV